MARRTIHFTRRKKVVMSSLLSLPGRRLHATLGRHADHATAGPGIARGCKPCARIDRRKYS
jgi:hypothetical protein